MAAMGVEGRVKGWIQKWLEGRKQRVVINGRYSDWTDVSNDVSNGVHRDRPRTDSLPYVH